ncbi:hypothetical protein ACQ4M4_24985 [Leptolyngbya sp. AN02str]|uniref:hypothetical protein n=1 Tax=Leptolyngbya sp. AN02str TaxID=3423363 RepID=UPI003D31D91F
MSALYTIQTLFQDPPIPYEPQKHTLKGWAKYCLQIRGFKVVYADKADFAVQTPTHKLYFNVATDVEGPGEARDRRVAWIVWHDQTKTATITPPDAEA